MSAQLSARVEVVTAGTLRASPILILHAVNVHIVVRCALNALTSLKDVAGVAAEAGPCRVAGCLAERVDLSTFAVST